MKNRTTRTHIAKRTGQARPTAAPAAARARRGCGAGAEPSKEIAIAERDVREGQVDTDNYTRMREVGEAACASAAELVQPRARHARRDLLESAGCP
jgi:hypothetical protein